mgnify:CR=1 FL=1
MSKVPNIRYQFYATLLDSFQSYLSSDEIWEKYWGSEQYFSPFPVLSLEAAEYLAGTKENILLATGAKELAAFAPLDPARLYPRVLPTPEGIAACEAAGIPHRNIIAMQGPFSCQLNKALIEQFHIRYLVTKDGGAAGGFAEKVQAAAETGAQLVVLRRPEEVGETEAGLFTHCQEILKWSH